MALNIRRGNALTLAQTSKVGFLVAGQGVAAGMVVNFDTADGVNVGSHATRLVGIALNSSTDSDVIGSQRVGVLLLDGASVIDTDQTATDVNITNYPVGTVVYGTTTGLITTNSTVPQVIGKVTGVRSLPAKIVVGSTVVQGFKAFLSLKLAT